LARASRDVTTIRVGEPIEFVIRGRDRLGAESRSRVTVQNTFMPGFAPAPPLGANTAALASVPPAGGKRRRKLRVALDPLRVILLVLMVLTISRVHEHFPFLAPLRPALLLVCLAFLIAVMNPRLLSDKALMSSWPPKLILAFAILACLSVAFGISPGASGLFVLQEYLPVMVFTALLILAVRRAEDLYALIWSLVIGGGILGYFANYVFQMTVYNGQARLGDMYMYDANDAGLIFTITIPLTLLTLQVSTWRGKLLSLLFLFWEFTAIARTGSRGAFLGVITIGLGLLFLASNTSIAKRIGILVGATLALMTAAPEGYWKQMQTITSPTDDYNWTSSTGRKQVAERGIKYMLDYPLAGIGIGNFGRAEGTISDRAKNWTYGDAGIKWSAPHNSHIEAAAELGIPGLIIWCTMLIGGIVGPLRLRRRLPKSWQRGSPDERFVCAATTYIPTAMLGFTTCCTFVSFTYLDPVYILLAFVSGLYVCSDVLLKRTSRPGNTARTQRSTDAGRFAVPPVAALETRDHVHGRGTR